MDEIKVDLCPTCGALVLVLDSGDGTTHFETYSSQEDLEIKEQVDRLLMLGGDKTVHLQAAVSEYLRRQQVMAERAQAHDLDDSMGMIPSID